MIMVINATFNNISVKSSFPEKTLDMTQVTDKLYHILSWWMGGWVCVGVCACVRACVRVWVGGCGWVSCKVQGDRQSLNTAPTMAFPICHMGVLGSFVG